MDKGNVLYTYHGILLTVKDNKFWNMCYMDESWRHYANWKKPGTERQILHHFHCCRGISDVKVTNHGRDGGCCLGLSGEK